MQARIIAIACVIVALASIAVSAFAGETGSPTPSRLPVAAPRAAAQIFLPLVRKPAPVPNFSHVYVIVMENQEATSIVGSASAPYLNGLIAQYGLATNYTGVTHPSQPNYMALFSGSTQGVIDDNLYDINAPNVADQMESKGRSWMTFAQNYPLNCYTGMLASGGADGVGDYARKHVPAMNFTSISQNPSRCGRITDFAHFDPAAADFEFIVPNLCNDMHDCPIATGDTFLAGFVPRILTSTAWKNGGVLFITWDEGVTYTGGGGVVATLVIANTVPAGYQSANAYNHYSLLRTIQNAWQLGCLGYSCFADDLAAFFP